MKSIETFKEHMLNYRNANYINRYCKLLDEFSWKKFYDQMKEPLQFVLDEEYLFYILKWILKEPFEDLSYEVYLQITMDPEQTSGPLIKAEWKVILDERYEEKLDELISELRAESSNIHNNNNFIF